MKEIKFRVWDKIRKKMLDVDFISESLFKPSGYEVEFVESDDFVIMQYIGLKDIDETKIYEADIFDYDGTKYVVEFDEERGGYFPFAKDDGCGCCSCEVVYYSGLGEVVGNKFENPELLGDDGGS